jgi:hypothetical protein
MWRVESEGEEWRKEWRKEERRRSPEAIWPKWSLYVLDIYNILIFKYTSV